MSDEGRVLTQKGRGQATRVGQFLKQHALAPDVILSSPYARASETARLVGAASGVTSMLVEPWLACGMRPQEALQELVTYNEFNRVAIIGHEPDFSTLVEHLLGVNSGGIHVRKASVILLSNVRPPSQRAFLEMMVPVKVLPAE